MAKVMVSIPDGLLARLDEDARRRGTTRSALLQALAERHLGDRDAERAGRVRSLLAAPRPRDGQAAEHVRADRSP